MADEGLSNVWAKSPDVGHQRGESLREHTWNVVTVVAQLYRLHPELGLALDSPCFWHRAYWAGFLHDFGKAADGFQRQLRVSGARWDRRHEVLSLAFVPWIIGPDNPDYPWVVAAIASHHKERDVLEQRYPLSIEYPEDDVLAQMVEEVPEGALEELWQLLNTHGNSWRDSLGLAPAGVQPLLPADKSTCVRNFRASGYMAIRTALHQFHSFALELKRHDARADTARAALALRGTIISADHLASAHVLRPVGTPLLGTQHTLAALGRAWEALHEHQRVAAGSIGSATLRAPTGSGKTEAALLWADTQVVRSQGSPRLFYVLPFQASMNAMYDRLVAAFGNTVGLQHGHSTHALYRRFLDRDWLPGDAERKARYATNLAKLHHPPVRVLSPFQLLKACYRLRGYEALLTDLFGGIFIFDEIHAYEAARLAIITKMIEYLARYHQASFFVMSATLPSLIQDRLATATGTTIDIAATPDLYRSFQRHRAYLLEGDAQEARHLERIADDAEAGKSVLVCCNTVGRAQETYDLLRLRLPASTYIDLLHGGFNSRDRSRKEQELMRRVNAARDTQQPTVFVATQVVEVSLDVDFDTLYSDPAPLEALLQRFGRINRRGKKGSAPVYIFREPADGLKIYDPRLVAAAMSCLESDSPSGLPIDEACVRDWLNAIYTGEIATEWTACYEKTAREFDAACLSTLHPFQASKELEDIFYQAFDAIEVLPAILEPEYRQLFATSPLEAASLLVGVRRGSFMGLLKKDKIKRDEDGLIIADAPYDSERGFRASGASE